jgi:hypothetical protein
VVIARTSLTSDLRAGVLLDATSFHTEPRGVQNRAGCCGTMQHCDFTGASEVLEEELEDLKKAFSTKTKGGRGVTPVTQAEENGLHAKSRL